MTPEEQNRYMSKQYDEAVRYMDNAKETLKRAGRDGSCYIDEKYVKTACGTAYNGVLIALDTWLKLKDVPEPSKKKRKSISYYTDNIAKLDKKMGDSLVDAYNVLHLSGYYDGVRRVKVIEDGFDVAYEIIGKIKPEHRVDVPETLGGKVKTALNRMTVALAIALRL
ncbi:hypothetical protein R80B4_00815 [Fibrobacteres bacterium R8-0-B4]